MVLKLGNKTIIETECEKDQNNPKFFKCFEFEHAFPGASTLNLAFYDQDVLRPDDLLGETNIDVERRFFDQIWRNNDDHPIE